MLKSTSTPAYDDAWRRISTAQNDVDLWKILIHDLLIAFEWRRTLEMVSVAHDLTTWTIEDKDVVLMTFRSSSFTHVIDHTTSTSCELLRALDLPQCQVDAEDHRKDISVNLPPVLQNREMTMG